MCGPEEMVVRRLLISVFWLPKNSYEWILSFSFQLLKVNKLKIKTFSNSQISLFIEFEGNETDAIEGSQGLDRINRKQNCSY